MSNKWHAFAVAGMLAGSAFAAEKESSKVTPNLDKGTKVLEGAGVANVMADELQLQLAYGQFVADGFEVALVAGLRDSERYMSTELGIRTEYNFVFDSALVPFLGAGVNVSDEFNVLIHCHPIAGERKGWNVARKSSTRRV